MTESKSIGVVASIFDHHERLINHKVIGLMASQGELQPQMGKRFLEHMDDPYVSGLFLTANMLYDKYNPDKSAHMDFTQIIETGTVGQISRTDIAQSLLTLLNILCLHELNTYGIKLHMLAGHSAGEYSALTDNVLTKESVMEAMVARGRITQEEMQNSIDLNEPQTSMYALKSKPPLDNRIVFELLRPLGLSPPGETDQKTQNHAGYSLINGAHDLVIWSENRMFEPLKAKLKANDILPVRLAIPTAFHADTPTMRRITERMSVVLQDLEWNEPGLPILMNATGSVAGSKYEIIHALLDNHTGTVNWLKCMESMQKEGINAAIQLGPGSFLSRQIGQVIPEVVNGYSGL